MSTNDEITAENTQGDSRRRRKGDRARGCQVRKRKKTSACWLSFEELPLGDDEIERAKCRKCGVVFQCDSATGTGSMLRHHNSCYTSTDSNVVSPQSATRSSKFNYDRFCELLIEAIIRHDLPFSFVEYEGIRAVFSYISPTLRLPCRNTVKAHVLKLFKSEKLKLESLLSSVQGRICLTSDLWTSVATDGYLTITAHFIDSEWRLQKRIINFCHMPPPHNGVALAEKINALLGEWGIEKKLFSITLDNASANDSFVEKLKTQLNFRGLLLMDGKFFHIRCCAHILNLIVQDGLKAIDHSVIKIRDCIKYIKSSSARKERFFDCVEQVGMGGCRRGLRQDVPTRWNSTYLMLDSALFYRRALINLGLSDNDFKFCPSPEEWNKIEKISKFLGYFYEVTCLFSGTKYPTSNVFSDILSSLFNVYVEKCSNPNPSNCSINESSSQTQGEDIFFEDFDNSYKNGSSSSVKTELHKYLDEERLDRKQELDVISWWKMEQFRYPILFHLACDVLTIPISTVASESAFSIGGRVLDQYRSSLLPDTVQALLCTRDWIFGNKGKEHADLEDLTEDIFALTLTNQLEESCN